MNLKIGILSVCSVLVLATSALASTLTKGTAVELAFDQALSSKTAKAGQRVRLHVINNVAAGGKVVIKRGTAITATISDVEKRGRFGKNAQLKLDIDPVSVNGVMVRLQPRQKGNMIGGTRGTTAAAASGGAAILLGPLGLGAGYFVVGKSVNVKVGDHLQTQVAEDVNVP